MNQGHPPPGFLPEEDPEEVEFLRKVLDDEIPMRKIGRNMPCPCGSGLKFKKCCYELKDPNKL